MFPFLEFLTVFSLLQLVLFCVSSPVCSPTWLIVPPYSNSVSDFHFLCGTTCGFCGGWYSCRPVWGVFGWELCCCSVFCALFCWVFPVPFVGFWCPGVAVVFLVCWVLLVLHVLLVCFSFCWLVVVLFCLFHCFGPGCWCVFVHISFVCLVCFWFCVVLLCSAFLVLVCLSCMLFVCVASGWFGLFPLFVGCWWLVHVAAGWCWFVFFSWCWLVCVPGVLFFAPGVFCVGSFFGGRLVLVGPLFCSWFMWWLVGPVASGG